MAVPGVASIALSQHATGQDTSTNRSVMFVADNASLNIRHSTPFVSAPIGRNGGGTSANDPNADSAVTAYFGPIRSGSRFVSPGIAMISYVPSKPWFVSTPSGSTRIFAGPFSTTTSAQ